MHASSPEEVAQALEPATREFYQRVIQTLAASGIPFLVGGAFAYQRYTGIARHTKDLDLFVKPADIERVLDRCAAAGYRTELTSPVWLAKVFAGAAFIDIIFSSGNGVAQVDDGWFEHAVEEVVLGQTARLVPAEEMIWSKGYVMERDRYDGADVAHLLGGRGARLDWPRLLARFGPHWRVLFSHLVLFNFIYPSARDCVPAWVLEEMIERLRAEMANPPDVGRICQGPLLAPTQYLVDTGAWGYADGRQAATDEPPPGAAG